MKRLLPYYKKYLATIIICLLVLFAEAIGELILPNLMSEIIDEGVVAGDMGAVRSIGIEMVLMAAAICICSVLVGYFSARVGAKIGKHVRNDLFERVTSFSNTEMELFSTASLITRSTNDIQQIQMTTILMLRLACFAPVMGIGALIMAIRTSPGLSWTILLALAAVLCVMVVSLLVTLPKFKLVQKMIDRINLVMGERLSGILVIRAFNTEIKEEERFDKANQDMMKINLFVNRAMSVMMPAMMLIMNLASVLIVWAGAKLIDLGDMQIGAMMAFIIYAMHVIISFLYISMMFIFIPRAMVSAGRIGDVLATEPSIKDSPEAAVLEEACRMLSESPEQAAAVAAAEPARRQTGARIEFRHVSFHYPDAEEDVLTDISFTAEAGKTTAVIGSTGSGKSTLVNLIPRFYDVTDGEILFNGVDIRNIYQWSLRENIGYVPQKGMLFSGTIESNLRYGNEEISDTELQKVIEISQAREFIDGKPEALAEAVAQGGGNVSGGQKQRLAIARALATKAPLYIFDDSFSALDFSTDAALRRALHENMSQATLIIVAQRINTIKDADSIVVLDEGHVAGIGTHKELLESCSVYREIAESQLSKEELQ